MKNFYFNLQLFGEIVHGYASDDNYSATGDDMQIYGMSGNDTIESMGKSRNLLIGGNGNDVLRLVCGDGTLAGGAGNDTFVLTYGPGKSISAVIEDVNPAEDGIVVFFDGNDTPQFNHRYDSNNVIWTDSTGLFNVTLKGTSDAKDYATSDLPEVIWTMLKLTNDVRAQVGQPALTMAENLAQASMTRAWELTQQPQPDHTRPNGTDARTILNDYYQNPLENASAGKDSVEKTVDGWVHSQYHYWSMTDHYNVGQKHFGGGYFYDESKMYKHYWIQMFTGPLTNPESRSADELMQAKISFRNQNGGSSGGGGGGGSAPVDTGRLNSENGVYKYNGGNHYITDYESGNKLQFNAPYKGFELIGSDLHLLSDSGVLNIVNPKDRLMNLADSNNNTVAYAYMAGSAQTVDGGAGSAPELIIGSSEATDYIIAGSGGSMLWGGAGFATDYMKGGSGKDEFYLAKGDGHDVILGYGAGDVIHFYNNNVINAGVVSDDLVLHGNESSITVKECRDRVIDVAYGNDVVGHAYLSSRGTVIDGRNTSGYLVLCGARDESDTIAAGNDGSVLWGCSGAGADILAGGNGADIFIYGAHEGEDYIYNGASNDMVYFDSVLSIESIYKAGDDLVIKSTDSDKLTVKSWAEGNLNTFVLADGSRYRFAQASDGSITPQRI